MRASIRIPHCNALLDRVRTWKARCAESLAGPHSFKLRRTLWASCFRWRNPSVSGEDHIHVMCSRVVAASASCVAEVLRPTTSVQACNLTLGPPGPWCTNPARSTPICARALLPSFRADCICTGVQSGHLSRCLQPCASFHEMFDPGFDRAKSLPLH